MTSPTPHQAQTVASPIEDIRAVDEDWAIVRVATDSGDTIEYEVMLG